MNTPIRVLTGIVLVAGAALAAGGFLVPPRGSAGMLVAAVLTLGLFPIVWLGFRPTRFEVDADALRIVWPLRTRTISRRAVLDASLVGAGEFQREHGYGMRIGVGGLFGAFGLLKTRTATFSMWVSRTDGIVLVRLRDARSLLLTPTDPERFVAALRA